MKILSNTTPYEATGEVETIKRNGRVYVDCKDLTAILLMAARKATKSGEHIASDRYTEIVRILKELVENHDILNEAKRHG